MDTLGRFLRLKKYPTPDTYTGYSSRRLRTMPGRIINHELACNNPLYATIRKLADHNAVPDSAWQPILEYAETEAGRMQGFAQIMERKAKTEHYLATLSRRYGAHYAPGFVSLTEAYFIYWVVRQCKPKTVVQTGAGNGLNSAFIMLALAQNGPDGRLYAVDMPMVFNPGDEAWLRTGSLYAATIPEGKSAGWFIPDQYRDRFELVIGNTKKELPKLVDRLDSIDLFYHDSDHLYERQKAEYKQALRKLSPGGTLMADGVALNNALWDFADKYRVPAFNFAGNTGLAFFSK